MSQKSQKKSRRELEQEIVLLRGQNLKMSQVIQNLVKQIEEMNKLLDKQTKDE